ncbi:MAG: HAD family hydrolase [Candidatus Aenigmarchaeota archaeon]|nr:HAD family hydrolase [Candidatus Aenigmarchaeota archaeon]
MPEVKACIFDGSGVLLDDVNAIFNISNRILEEMKLEPVTFEDFQGRTKIPFWEYYKSFGLSEFDSKATDFYFKKFYPLFFDDVKLYPEVNTVLQQLKSRGIKLGIVTHLPKEVVSRHLQSFGIQNYFDAIITFDDTDEHKPSPKPLLIALSKIGVDITDAVFIGDMVEDILTGKRAGVKTVAVLRNENPYQTRDKVIEQNPDYLISNLAEIFSNGIIR